MKQTKRKCKICNKEFEDDSPIPSEEETKKYGYEPHTPICSEKCFDKWGKQLEKMGEKEGY